ncbi:hypothetical protein BC831DRAFT_458541 [Entophlyctis helioformis]|nr:hypothetical protein BC831DRAFT_458541 [Entophlyctis helioformis]
MPTTAGQMCVVMAAIEVLAAGGFFIVFYRMSPTIYSIGLRVSCLLVIPAAALQVACVFSIDPAVSVSAASSLYSVTSVFVLTQLEFLKTLASLFSSIKPITITRVQIAIAVISVFYVATGFSSHIASAIWSGVVGLYDVSQQCLLLFCVLRRLPATTPFFKVVYSLFAIVGCSVLLAGLGMSAMKRTREQSVLMNLCIPAFALCSFATMELFRLALQHSKRPAKPKASKDKLINSAKGFKARFFKHISSKGSQESESTSTNLPNTPSPTIMPDGVF